MHMTTNTKDKGYTVPDWCKVIMGKAEERTRNTDVFCDWDANTAGAESELTTKERAELAALRIEVAALRKKKNAAVNPSTTAAEASASACFLCKQEGHRKSECPQAKKKNTPAKAGSSTAKAQPAASSRKVNSTRLSTENDEFDSKMEAAVNKAVALLMEKGWTPP